MAWFILLIAGLCEIGWATGLKYSEGFTRVVPSVLTIVAMVVSIVLLGIALKTLPVGTGYAVWTGIGAVGVTSISRTCRSFVRACRGTATCGYGWR